VSVVSWNANGLRARLASKQYGFLLAEDGTAKYDVVCVQETKADEAQIRMPADLSAAYPYRCYESTRLRKGQSGTALWSRRPFRARVPSPPTDMEGRVCAADFGTFVAVSVYVPNSGTKHTFRTGLWHATFSKYLDFLVGPGRPVLVCMDANVCHEEIDIYAPGKHRNKVAGFYDIERQQFAHYLSRGFTDAFRAVHPDTRGAYTWFNPRVPQMRERNLGWRLDVVLVGGAARVAACTHLGDVRGSDHIPVVARVQVPAHVPSADKQVPRICNAWLRPHSALLARLSATCPLTAAAYQVLQREWTTNMVDSDDESMSTECTSGPGNPNDTRGFFRADGLDAQ
jgi:exodeoxyribonuclease-3